MQVSFNNVQCTVTEIVTELASVRALLAQPVVDAEAAAERLVTAQIYMEWLLAGTAARNFTEAAAKLGFLFHNVATVGLPMEARDFAVLDSVRTDIVRLAGDAEAAGQTAP